MLLEVKGGNRDHVGVRVGLTLFGHEVTYSI